MALAAISCTNCTNGTETPHHFFRSRSNMDQRETFPSVFGEDEDNQSSNSKYKRNRKSKKKKLFKNKSKNGNLRISSKQQIMEFSFFQFSSISIILQQK